jgi:L-threonylcarbamoyladenylate synthase
LRIELANTESIDRAAAILRRGGLVAFATETVYGLGADAANDRAVAAIFAAKQRPSFNPLIVHARDLEHAGTLATFSAQAQALAEKFWPGPLTLVLPRRSDANLSLLVSAGLDTVAVRVPANSTARSLLCESGLAIAAPSANCSGSISPTTAIHVAKSLESAVELVLDDGATPLGIESTIIGFDGARPLLLRPGALPRERIEQLVGKLGRPPGGAISSPGQFRRHYAPRTLLRIDATTLEPGEALLAFGHSALTGACAMRNLSPAGELEEAAANLFSMLRELDELSPRSIAVMSVPNHGLGEAINDRLRRAAAREGN